MDLRDEDLDSVDPESSSEIKRAMKSSSAIITAAASTRMTWTLPVTIAFLSQEVAKVSSMC